MALWEKLTTWWRPLAAKQQEPSGPPTPQQIQDLPALDDASFNRESKKYLQRLDELITASEGEIDTLTEELNRLLHEENTTKDRLRNNKESWAERQWLLRLERITIHRKNVEQRIEIYNQNIRVYLNLISRIQDVHAMKMGGIDQSKIESVWLEFIEGLEQYKERLMLQEANAKNFVVTTPILEQNLKNLKKETDISLPTQSNKEITPITSPTPPITFTPLSLTPPPPPENSGRENNGLILE